MNEKEILTAISDLPGLFLGIQSLLRAGVYEEFDQLQRLLENTSEMTRKFIDLAEIYHEEFGVIENEKKIRLVAGQTLRMIRDRIELNL